MVPLQSVEDMNNIFDNKNNFYYGHGTPISEDIIKNSIFEIGLRCSHNYMAYTTFPITQGGESDESHLKELENWNHKDSSNIVILSLPVGKYNLNIDDPYRIYDAYYYHPTEKSEDKAPYVMPQFVKGYYNKITKMYTENPHYYEHLSKDEQDKLFKQVRKNLYNEIKDSYERTSKNYDGGVFSPPPTMSIIEYIRYLNETNQENPFTTEEVGIDWALEALKDLEKKNNVDIKMKLPNGNEISIYQYMTEFIPQFIPPSGTFKLKSGVEMSATRFIEEYVLSELGQEKYNGDIKRLIDEYTISEKSKDDSNLDDRQLFNLELELFDELDRLNHKIYNFSYDNNGLVISKNPNVDTSVFDQKLEDVAKQVEKDKDKYDKAELEKTSKTQYSYRDIYKILVEKRSELYNPSEKTKANILLSELREINNMFDEISTLNTDENLKLSMMQWCVSLSRNLVSSMQKYSKYYDSFSLKDIETCVNKRESVEKKLSMLTNDSVSKIADDDPASKLRRCYANSKELARKIENGTRSNGVYSEDVEALQESLLELEASLEITPNIDYATRNEILNYINRSKKFLLLFEDYTSTRIRGFSKIGILALSTAVISIGILLLGVFLSK